MKTLILFLITILTLASCSDSRTPWLVEQEEIFTDLYHDAFPGEEVIHAWRVNPKEGFPVKNELGIFQYTGYGIDAVVRGKDNQCRLFEMTLACTEKTQCFKVRHGGSRNVACDYES
jgi:hypothetical protein